MHTKEKKEKKKKKIVEKIINFAKHFNVEKEEWV